MIFSRRPPRLTRLLIVEDEPLLAFDAEHLLTEHDYQVVATVDRVADAERHLASGVAIDLVLADVMLADGNGTQVARTAQSLGIAVMFLTASCPPDASELAVGCLAKPYSQGALLAAIRAVEAAAAGRKPGRLPAGFKLFDRT
jgi:DNA-binding response OmpR family regulator